jgi:hypothetical protein
MSDHQKALFLSQAIIKTCLEFFPDRDEFSPPIVMTAIAHAMAFGLVEEFEENGEAIRAMSKLVRPMLKHHRDIVKLMHERAERKPPKLVVVWDREKA